MKRNLAVLALALLAAAPLTASTFVAMTPNELVAQADAVVIGQVVDRVSAWTDSGRLIYTDNTLRVDEVVLGEAPAFVTVRTFGDRGSTCPPRSAAIAAVPARAPRSL